MKQNPKILRTCEYIPDNIAQKIVELADNRGGKPNVRHDNYLAITSTIYFKCINENGYPFIPYLLASNYWKDVVGDRYREYMMDLLNAGIIQREKKGRRWRYAIDTNLILQLHELKPVNYKTERIQSLHRDKGYSAYEVQHIENRLGGRILKHLSKVSVAYDAFQWSYRDGSLDANPDDFKLDISEFPMDMDFDAEIHYPHGTTRHNYKVKTLLERAKVQNLSIFHDKDRIRVISDDSFKNIKTRNFINHSKLNLLKTIDGNYELSRDEDKTRRVFHTGVFLPSKALPFIRIDGEEVVGIDAKTSQFLLLANLFNAFIDDVETIASKFDGKRKTFIYDLFHTFKEQETNREDVELFYNDVVNDDFYSVVQEFLGLSQRSQAKIFCFSIIFSKPDTANPFKEKLRDRYPSVINTLDAYKYKQMERLKKEKGKKNIDEGDGFQRLPINLQALEAEIFIDHIFKRLHKEQVWCFTRHDSVVVGQQHQVKALAIAENVYRDLGLTSKFEIEEYHLPEPKSISSLPDEWTFLYFIDEPEDITRLELQDLYMLLEELQNHVSPFEYNQTESRIIELDRHQLPLDSDSINSLYNLSINLLTKYSSVS